MTLKPRLHDTTCCQTVWQPGKCLYTRYNRLSNALSNRFSIRFDNKLYRVYSRLYNPVWQPVEPTVAVRSTRLSHRFDNRLYRVNKHPTSFTTGLTAGLTTGWMFVYMIQPVVKAVVQPVWQPVVSCKRGFNKNSSGDEIVNVNFLRPHRTILVCNIQHDAGHGPASGRGLVRRFSHAPICCNEVRF